jgi:hypothetical protein
MVSRPAAKPLLLATIAILAAASGLHCGPTIVLGQGGGPGSGTPTSVTSIGTTWTTSSESGPTGSVISSSGGPTPCVILPSGTKLTAFYTADSQGGWSEPSIGMTGALFLDPPSAGSFSTQPNGTEVKYTQQQQDFADLTGDPSFGLWFSHCVSASSAPGVLFTAGSTILHPAGSGIRLTVQTLSTTPAPRGTCVPSGPADCVAPSFPTNYGDPTVSYTWDQLTGGSPAQTGAQAAQEIVGLRWTWDSWEGPPPGVVAVDYVISGFEFSQ